MRALLVLSCLVLAACAPAAGKPAALPDRALPSTDGAAHRLPDLVRAAPFTVVFFFSADCSCQRAHDARLRELAATYEPRGVRFVAVDAEATATVAGDAREAKERGYTFPMLTDPEGTTADALGAVWATYAVVMDARGTVHYRGGLDSDRSTTTAGATLWLRDAIDHALAGQPAQPAETASLGCALRRK